MNTGTPITTAHEKHISCLLVKLKATFVLTFDKSFGTGTNGITENGYLGVLFIATYVLYEQNLSSVFIHLLYLLDYLPADSINKLRIHQRDNKLKSGIWVYCSDKQYGF